MTDQNSKERAEAWNDTQLRSNALNRIFQAAEVLGVTSMTLKDVTLGNGEKENWSLERKGLGRWDIKK